jgi:hypothetical protein
MQPTTGELAPDGGEIKRNDGRIACLSQRLDLLDLDRTAAESFAAFAPERREARAARPAGPGRAARTAADGAAARRATNHSSPL